MTRIPEISRETVTGTLEKLSEDIYRAGPESVVDRARDAATAILSAYAQANDLAPPGRDLGDLIKAMDHQSSDERKEIVVSAAKIVARLHARAKHAEREKRLMRAIREQDAELSVQCIGVILCDLGWGDWR